MEVFDQSLPRAYSIAPASKAFSRQPTRLRTLCQTQFGIGKPGGVEPILRYTERAVDDKLPGIRHHYMVEADLKNASNKIDRKFIA